MPAPFSSGRPRVWTEGNGLRALPREWGAYRFIYDDGSVAYIGITSNLYNRISQHRSSGKIYGPDVRRVEYQVALDGTPWDALREWERAKIRRHSPGLNVVRGGNGRRPAIQVAGRIIEVGKYESYEDALVRNGFFNRFFGGIARFFSRG